MVRITMFIVMAVMIVMAMTEVRMMIMIGIRPG